MEHCLNISHHCNRLLAESGPLTVHPNMVLTAYGPSPLLFTTSHGSKAFGTLLPINNSTSALILGMLTSLSCVLKGICERLVLENVSIKGGGYRLDDGNPTWIDLSSAAERVTGKSSSAFSTAVSKLQRQHRVVQQMPIKQRLSHWEWWKE
ncbi:hypothetical protein N1851_020134 [Merluccius polli]|uniref:Uncharacterized protein n=1 Tax=Merluccius polli TaxID=89951 RepID=A0AA47MKT6_MERPO|nr:hypothetical protein N1851_020134 [Merluccius polli]